jgi:outer membrane protein
VAEAGVTSAEGHREQVKARVALGDAAEVEVLPAEDDLARAQLDLIEARGDVRLALVQLRNAMGLPAQASPRLAPGSPPTREQLPPLEDALATGLGRRPEVAAGEVYVRANGYALKQAKIRRGPSIDLSGQYNRGYTDWEGRDPSWNLLLSLSWPLFDGHAGKADETAANASLVRAEADLDRLAKQVVLEIESALIAADSAGERLEASATSVAAAEARLAAAEAMYQQGLGILLEVIDARGSVTSARAAQVRAGFDYQVALVALDRAMGVLSDR